MERMSFNDDTPIGVGGSQVKQSNTGHMGSERTVEAASPAQSKDGLDFGHLTFLDDQPVHPFYLPIIKERVSVLSIYTISVDFLPEVY